MDKIFIRDLKISAIIGTHPWERELKQTLKFDLDLLGDIKPGAEKDDIKLTLDYQQIASSMTELVENSESLIE